MKSQRDMMSPFLQKRDIPPIYITEENPRITNSPIYENMYRQQEQMKNEQKDISPLRYSNNIDNLRSLRQRSHSPEAKFRSQKSIFKKHIEA